MEKIEAIKKNIQEKDAAITSLKEKISFATELAKPLGPKLRLNTKQTSKSSTSELTIRIYGNQLPFRQNESYKTFRVSPADDCVKLIMEAMQKYKLQGDWKEYVLLLVVNDLDNICLNPSDRIVQVSQRYSFEDLMPNFVIQHTRYVNGPISKPLNLDPGTFLAASVSLFTLTLVGC
jgi:acetone carboxylase gamma subunit